MFFKKIENLKKTVCLTAMILLAISVFADDVKELLKKPLPDSVPDAEIKTGTQPFIQFKQTTDGTIITGKMTYRNREGIILWAQIKSGKDGNIVGILDGFANNMEFSVGISSLHWKPSMISFALIDLVRDIHFEDYKAKDKNLTDYKDLRFTSMDLIHREDKVLIENLLLKYHDIDLAATAYLEIKCQRKKNQKAIRDKFHRYCVDNQTIKNLLKNNPFIFSVEIGTKYSALNYFDISNSTDIKPETDKKWDCFAGITIGKYLDKITVLGLSLSYRSSWEPIDSGEPISSDLQIPRNWFSNTTYLEPLFRKDKLILHLNVKMYTKNKRIGLNPGAVLTFKTPPESKPEYSFLENHSVECYLGIFWKLGNTNKPIHLSIKPFLYYDNLKKKVTFDVSLSFTKEFRLKKE